MKRLLCVILALTLAITCAATAFAAGKLKVAEENLEVYEAYSGYDAYLYAVMTNEGDDPVEFNAGMFEVLNPDGDSIDANEYISCMPSIINPGEKGYVRDYISVDDAESADYIADYSFTSSGKTADENTNVAIDCTATVAMRPYSYTSTTKNMTAVLAVTNNTDETLYEINAVFAIHDADGKLIYVDYISPYNVGILPGSTIELVSQINSEAVEAWEKNGVKPASIESYAYSKQGW